GGHFAVDEQLHQAHGAGDHEQDVEVDGPQDLVERQHPGGDKDRRRADGEDRKSTRLHSSHVSTSYAVFCLKKKNPPTPPPDPGGTIYATPIDSSRLGAAPDRRRLPRPAALLTSRPASAGRSTTPPPTDGVE